MTRKLALAAIVTSAWIAAPTALQQAPPPAPLALHAPKTIATTPAACLQEINDWAAKRTAEIQATLPPAQPATDQTEAMRQMQARSLAMRPVSDAKLAMTKECAAKFDVNTLAAADLPALLQLYMSVAPADPKTTELTKTAAARLVALKGQAPADRAANLSLAVTATLREVKSDERNARLEKIVDELDKLPDTFVDKKFDAHLAMYGYYRYDDIDAGIIKHSTWLMQSAKDCDPTMRKKYAPRVISAYVGMAEAWAGQGKNDEAIALLRRAPKDFPEIPTAEKLVQPEIERLELVGTPSAPLTAPRWLNMPAGKTTLDLKGSVTLLEFSAHWCVPCKESYPGVNRLLAKYKSQGFQVALVTKLYGYLGTKTGLSADAEFAEDKIYFAEHGMNVPIAVGDQITTKVVDGKLQYLPGPDPNDTAYKVGGIPQIHLVDKKGKIRLVMVGYDDANEAKLATMIEAMLKEK